ncbi:ammonium transporter [bacterium]|nr:ammonium transporter [bacterium]
MVTLVKLNKHIDDAMDVFSVHGITGFVGALLIGAFILSPAPGLGGAPIMQTASGVFAPAGLPAGIYNQATTIINGTTYFTGGLMPGIYYSAPTMAHGYQFGIELGAVCLVAA